MTIKRLANCTNHYYLEAEGKGFVWPLVSASYTAFEMSLPTAFITSTSSCLLAYTTDKK